MANKIKRIAAIAMSFLLACGVFGLFLLVRKHEQEKEEIAAKEEYEQVAQNFRDRYFQNKDNLYLLWDGAEFPIETGADKKATVDFREELTVDWGDGEVTNGGNEHIYADNQRYHLIVVSGDIQQSDMQDDMFFRCRYLRKIAIPQQIALIPVGMCNRAGLDEVILPDKLESIGRYAFFEDSFRSIQLPNGLKTIGQSAFGIGSLETIELPETVINIENGAFASCSSLKSVRFKGSLPSFGGSDIFSSCLCLETIIVPRHEFVNYKGSPYLSAWNDKIVYE